MTFKLLPMKPRNKIEREVVRLSTKVPHLSDKQQAWAIKTCIREEDAYKFSDRFARGSFYIVCTFKGWQVLRYFQVRAKFKYHKMTDKIYFTECMQQWLKDGEYVFLAKQRLMGYQCDAFSMFGKLEVRTHTMWGALGDPRDIGWCGVYYASVQKKYQYALKDLSKIDFDILFRAINASSYNETLMRKNIEVWKDCLYHNAVYDKNKLAAIKIAIRHGKSSYLYDSLWWDMLDSLIYLKKDLHNPSIVCPADLEEAHDRWLAAMINKKKKVVEKMGKLRQIQDERRTLRYLEEQAKREEENKKKAKSLASVYIARRKNYFGVNIVSGSISINVLRSVEEFFEEGKEMGHCVFANSYYDVNQKPNCLILSAKVNGQRMETIEVNLSTLSVVQCQGKHNVNSPFHDTILKIMNDNMWMVKNCLPNCSVRSA